MVQVQDAVVRGGQVVLDGLPFKDGQFVRVSVVEATGTPDAGRLSIEEVRRLLAGGVERFDDPFEPVIPVDDWEALG